VRAWEVIGRRRHWGDGVGGAYGIFNSGELLIQIWPNDYDSSELLLLLLL